MFYAVVGNHEPYIFTFQDDKRGINLLVNTGADDNTNIHIFIYLRQAFFKDINNDPKLTPGTPLALWVQMMENCTII